ncbi:MAG: hypothetical protein AAGB06_03185 [Verrucomicrobiota bacterium]
MEKDMTADPRSTESVNRHILIIDDNQSIHDDYRRILLNNDSTDETELQAAEAFLFDEEVDETGDGNCQFDFELEHALSGKEGLDILNKFKDTDSPISLAFVDMRMPPGWNGVETIEHLWSTDPRLQVVICSAYSDVSWESIRKQFGKRDNLLILRKPFEPEEVQQLAASLTEKWDQEVNGKTIYTVAPEYPLRLVEVKPKKITSKALICEDFVSLPNGENKKVIRRDLKDVPTTPTRALQQFLENQGDVVAELTEKLSVENGKLEQARVLLNSLENGEV